MSDTPSGVSSLPVLRHVFAGTFIHTPNFGSLEVLENYLLAVDMNGIICFLDADNMDGRRKLHQNFTLPPQGMTVLAESQFIIPGFIDTHCHAPQYQFAGAGTDRDLMLWLETYTFPAEMRMKSNRYARKVYEKLVESALSHGTTTVFYYGTIHLEATKILVDICAEKGQRAFVGKVNMDMHSPSAYIESTQDSLRDTEAFIEYVRSLNNPLIEPVITPRFIPTCSLELLRGLSELAHKHNCWIQSHISESSDQVEFVRSIHPDMGGTGRQDDSSVNDLVPGRCTSIFQQLNLLTDQCMMAHGTYLTTNEWQVLKQKGVSLSHCPLSNYFCSDHYLKVKPLIYNESKVSLGTDIAGGYSISILNNMRQAVVTSKVYNMVLRDQDPDEGVIQIVNRKKSTVTEEEVKEREAKKGDNTLNDSTLSYRDAFWLGTYGGAIAINRGNSLGLLRVGYEFDAQLICTAACPNTPHFEHDSIQDAFSKYFHLGDDRSIIKVWVKGREVKNASNPNCTQLNVKK